MSRFLGTSAALALLLMPASLRAQALEDLGTLVLSASRTPVEAERTGATVEIVDPVEDLATSPIQLSARLSRLPGVSASGNGGLGGVSSLRIRGLPDRYIGVRLNGIDITDPSSVQTQFNFGGLTGAGLGRAEVLKGSQSALYGSEAIGGVVSLFSRRASEPGTEYWTNLEIGSFNTVRAEVGVATRAERGEISLSVSRITSDGFSAADEADGNTEADGFDGTIALLSASYDLTETLRAGVDLIWSDEETNIDAFGGPGGDADQPFFTDRAGARVYLQFDTGAWEQEIGVSYFETERRDPETAFGSPFFDSSREEVFYQATGQFGATRLTFGAEYSEETATFDNGTFSSDLFSAYGEVLQAYSDTLDVSYGLRVDDHSEFGTETTGRVALSWRFAPEATLRAALSTGFRAPSLNELFGPFNFSGNPDLEPETSRSAELGVTRRFSGQSFVEATLFYTEIDNLIDYPVDRYEQVPGTSVTQGIEISGRYDITREVGIFAAYTYTDARDADGDQLRRVPEHDLLVGLDASLADRWGAEVTLQHIAGRADDGFPAEPVDDYTLVAAGISYAVSDRVETYLRLENLTDEQYNTVPGFGTPGRSAFLGIRGTF